MGTQYSLFKSDSFGELNIDEMSNELTLEHDSNDLFGVSLSESMPPEELVKILGDDFIVKNH